MSSGINGGGGNALLLARVVSPGSSFSLPPQVVHYFHADSWQCFITKAVFAATYGAGVYMAYRHGIFWMPAFPLERQRSSSIRLNL